MLFSNGTDQRNQSDPIDSLSVLPDLLDSCLDIVFCGTAVGKKSAKEGVYYSGKGNKFWKVIHEVGLTPIQLRPDQYRELLKYKIGLTDLAKKVSGNDAELRSNDFDVYSLKTKIAKYHPKILAFNGKKVAKIFFNTNEIDHGLVADIKIANTKIYILPSTSGSANRSWDISYWNLVANELINPQ